MAREIAVLACALLCACDASIGGAPTGGDANNGDGNTVRMTDADNGPACSNGRVVYLNFEGVTLTKAGASDATQNKASWLNKASGTAPPFLQGVGTRQMTIDAITQGVRDGLAQFPITVVTQRPATGPYVMIVYGGSATQIGSNFGNAVNELDCDESEKSDVAWIQDNNFQSVGRHVNTTIGAIGFGLGLTGTTSTTDCMCGWANNCTKALTPCTLSMNIARDPTASQLCAGAGNSQNEVATFSKAFCQ